MPDTVITVENLSKRYLIGHQSAQRERYTALRDVIGREARNFLRKASDLVAGRQIVQGDEVEDIWALKDVTFDIKKGEVVGIIGRNGAGKSTLLKVLSRITEPTYGTVKLRGRVGSLLEVGTGFHPELTGRENIYLNGAVLGMARRDIKKRFDEIVAFAEVEKFLDTPVKRFSSGMYVRLAFAVAAHLESEILILDEVLAVGDVEFQKKCLGKIGEVVSSGRAALIVSHNLQTIVSLCSRAIVMDQGTLVRDGKPDAVVSSYLSRSLREENHVLFRIERNTEATDVTSVELLDESGQAKSTIGTFDFVRFRVGLNCQEVSPQGSVVLEIRSSLGFVVLKIETHPSDIKPLSSKGDHWIDCCIESLPLAPGHYLLSVGLAVYGVCLLSWRADVANLVVAAPPNFQQAYGEIGSLAVRHRWSTASEQTKASPAKASDKSCLG